MRRALVLALFLSAAGCVGSQDNPTNVHDLRVLGASFEPPEIFAVSCYDDSALAVFASPVVMTALVADPAGAGRSIDYDLRVCASQGDTTCTGDGALTLTRGSTGPGELVVKDVPASFNPNLRLPLMPGAQLVDGGTPLLEEVVEHDLYQGLGGIRLPAVLHVKAGDEEVFAKKLLVFTCKLLPEMTPNHTPRLPGLLLEGEPWPDDALPDLQGSGPFAVEPEDFQDRLEPYVVPSYSLKPVHLSELWIISWRADMGTFSEGDTGGTGFDGIAVAKHHTEWTPGPDATERDVTFWAVVRDGRGGESWLVRKAHWRP